MIQCRNVLAVITARGGSKGIPRKNIQSVAGKPLIAWTIEAAKKSQFIDKLIVSTEDAEIAQVAKDWGCEVPFMRPKELALDETPGVVPVLHAIREIPGFEYVVLLQPTSPFRTTEDIDSCIYSCVSLGAHACVSVTESPKSPYLMYQVNHAKKLTPVLQQGGLSSLRRQDLPSVYMLNGAVYIAECTWLEETHSFLTDETIAQVMPAERSLDIDTELDLLMANTLLSSRISKE